MESPQYLTMLTIYWDPSDYPGRFVVRRWTATNPPTPDPKACAVCLTLTEARAAVPDGLVRIPRHPTDDPVIIETWV